MVGSPNFLLALNILSGVFMAAAIEAVETYTQVVCVARCISKKAALTGFLLAVGVLAGLTATLGMTIIYLVPIQLFHLIFGVFALLVGMRWLRDGVLRYSGWLALRDEAALYKQSQAQLLAASRVQVETTSTPTATPKPTTGGQFWFGVVACFKPTFIEGLETVYLVLVLGYPYRIVAEAAGTALAAYVLVGLVALALFSGPLRAVPINLLKGIIGLQMTVLGTMWTGTALGIVWWRENLSYFVVLGVYVAIASGLTHLLKHERTQHLARQTEHNGKLFRHSRTATRTMLINQAQAQVASASGSGSGLVYSGWFWLATLNRLFLGDRVILVGLPVMVYLTWQITSDLASANILILVFPQAGLFLIGGLAGLLGLASWYFADRVQYQENTLLLQSTSPDSSKAEAAR